MSPDALLVGLRGATTVTADEAVLIHAATTELLDALVERNALVADRIVSAIFTSTPDLRSEFPARAARDMGLSEVPMLCATEIAVPGSIPRCIRVLLHVAGPLPHPRGVAVYLRGAALLRPDLARGQP